jgi:hypothetical protein
VQRQQLATRSDGSADGGDRERQTRALLAISPPYGRCTAASVRQAAAVIDHKTVTAPTRLHLRQQLDAEV